MSDEATYDGPGILTTLHVEEGCLPSHLVFHGAKGAAVLINVATDPPTVKVDESLAWDAAAKQFWNAVCRVVGRPAIFPDE